MSKHWVFAVAFASILAGCVHSGTEGVELAHGHTLRITPEVWRQYQDYLTRGRGLGPDRTGVFAVAVMNQAGVAGLGTWLYCPRMYDGCRPIGGQNPVSKVLDACRREKVECIIFARNEDIQVSYAIED